MNRIGKVKSTLVGIMVGGGLLAFSPTVVADTVLDMDINNFTISGGSSFAEDFTGTITFEENGSTSFALWEIRTGTYDLATGTFSSGGSAVSSFSPFANDWTVTEYSGSITFEDGLITVGNFRFEVTNTVTSEINLLTGSLAGLTGRVIGDTDIDEGPDGIFDINASIFGGEFDGDFFATADVTAWNSNEPFLGAFFNFNFRPDNPSQTNAEIAVLIPAPLAAPWGLAGLIGVIVARRRRNKRRVAA